MLQLSNPISAADIRARTGAHERIAFVSGNFNVIHAGHMRLLKFAAEAADKVVVGLNHDANPGVTVPLALRAEAVRAIALVTHVIDLQHGPASAIQALKPDVVVKGKEFENVRNEEQEVVASYGGKLIFGSGEMRFSSFDLLQREFLHRQTSSIRMPHEYPARHGFDAASLKAVVESFSGLRVLVIGDLIVDDYITCDPLGMSQEDPTIVVTPIDTKTFVGGAGIVSAHAKGLGATVRFLTVAGRDHAARFAKDKLGAYGVEAAIITDSTRPTTVKARYRANGKTLLRVNDLRQHAIDHDIQVKMIRKIRSWLADTDLILFSDFNYGCLPQPLLEAVVTIARRRGIAMAADSQASSQLADISRFMHMSVVTPTEREARLALHDSDSGLAVIASRLRAKAKSGGVIVTMGAEGSLVVGDSHGEERLDQLPAFNSSPKDVAGAGDSLFTCVAMALCRGHDIWRAAYLGSVAAAIQVARVGNLPIQREEVIAELLDRRR
jgi:rfaE bifunctional protein kinase chain/domain